MNWGRLSKTAAYILNLCNSVLMALILFSALRISFSYSSMSFFVSSVWTSFLSWLISSCQREISFWSLATSLSIFWWVQIWTPGRCLKNFLRQVSPSSSSSSCCFFLLKETSDAAVACHFRWYCGKWNWWTSWNSDNKTKKCLKIIQM